jgi:hypothetical protein
MPRITLAATLVSTTTTRAGEMTEYRPNGVYFQP